MNQDQMDANMNDILDAAWKQGDGSHRPVSTHKQ